jgi:hypothetical protein
VIGAKRGYSDRRSPARIGGKGGRISNGLAGASRSGSVVSSVDGRTAAVQAVKGRQHGLKNSGTGPFSDEYFVGRGLFAKISRFFPSFRNFPNFLFSKFSIYRKFLNSIRTSKYRNSFKRTPI